MTEKKTGRDRGDGATREGLLLSIHANCPGNSARAQQGRLLAAMHVPFASASAVGGAS